MLYIGIDPGKSGALAILDEQGAVRAVPFEELRYLNELTAAAEHRCFACVEKVGAMPGQGVTSMFTFGHNLGWIEGVLRALAVPYQLVPPRTWKKEFSLNGSKEASVSVCRRLFPALDLLPTPRCRRPSDGMAEAALMAEYARRHFHE